MSLSIYSGTCVTESARSPEPIHQRAFIKTVTHCLISFFKTATVVQNSRLILNEHVTNQNHFSTQFLLIIKHQVLHLSVCPYHVCDFLETAKPQKLLL